MLGNSDLPLSAISARGLEAPNASAAATGVPGALFPAAVMVVTEAGSGRHPVVLQHPRKSMAMLELEVGGHGGFDYLRNLAEASGGRAFYNTNGLAGSIRRVIDDSSTTYLAGLLSRPQQMEWRIPRNQSESEPARRRNPLARWLLRCRGHRFRSEEVCPAIGSGNPQPTRINGPWNGCTRGCD